MLFNEADNIFPPTSTMTKGKLTFVDYNENNLLILTLTLSTWAMFSKLLGRMGPGTVTVSHNTLT